MINNKDFVRLHSTHEASSTEEFDVNVTSELHVLLLHQQLVN